MKSVFKILTIVLAWSSLARADMPAVHGMLIFGDKVTYASHLPMFHSPHDYQVILQLSLQAQSNSSALSKFAAAKSAGQSFFTLAPEVMDLTQVINGSKSSFSGHLFQGHFEQDGIDLGGVTVQVEKIIFSTKLDAQDNAQDIKYLVFGQAGEYFAAHLILGKPNYDAVLSVSQPYQMQDHPCHLRACPDPEKTLIGDDQ